jgi:hypothetical protein
MKLWRWIVCLFRPHASARRSDHDHSVDHREQQRYLPAKDAVFKVDLPPSH